jgi:hypothetical protein
LSPFLSHLPIGWSWEFHAGTSDWQLSALAQVCSSSFPHAFISTVERLYFVEDGSSRLNWQDDIENSQWLELLHPFTAVKNLFLTPKFTPRIAPALQELVGERADEVLPALQSILLEGLHLSEVVPEEIGKFATARRLSSHPIDVIPWIRSPFLLSHFQFAFVFLCVCLYLLTTHHLRSLLFGS